MKRSQSQGGLGGPPDEHSPAHEPVEQEEPQHDPDVDPLHPLVDAPVPEHVGSGPQAHAAGHGVTVSSHPRHTLAPRAAPVLVDEQQVQRVPVHGHVVHERPVPRDAVLGDEVAGEEEEDAQEHADECVP